MSLADTISKLAPPLRELAQPFAACVGAVATGIGLFVVSVPSDKLWITAGMAGVAGLAKGYETHMQAKYGADTKQNGDHP